MWKSSCPRTVCWRDFSYWIVLVPMLKINWEGLFWDLFEFFPLVYPYASTTVSLLLLLCSKFWNQVVWVFLFILLFKIALSIWDTLQFPLNFSVSFSDCVRMSVEILLEIVLNVSSEICEVYNMISALFFSFFLVYFGCTNCLLQRTGSSLLCMGFSLAVARRG